ncbi:NAD(P)/FAD-dependent oxidoreductase [Pseudonocardia dioxanivorans]|nr:FAD-dependent oxidoreductase [Pseudonocardia dioxanivorans]
MADPLTREPRIVIVGSGFAGYHAARALARLVHGAAQVSLVSSTDYFLYLPLLPEVATAILDPRRVTVPLAATLPGVSCVLSEVSGVDVEQRRIAMRTPEGRAVEFGYDRLVIAVGSVNRLLPIPGVPRIAHGFRGIPEALYLRDHVTRQIELAELAEDPTERAARCTFVVVGAGYTGTELAAQGPLFTAALVRARPALHDQPIRWLLLDTASRVLPGLDPRLGRTADQVLRRRGVEIGVRTSITEATDDAVRLTNGQLVPTRSLIWCVGVRPDPLVDDIGLPTRQGRLVVDEYLTVPGHPELFACGDAAAVPDPARPGELAAMTAQHAQRQGRLAARNVAATLGRGTRAPYRHRDLGFAVDLGGTQAAANPVGIPLSGPLAKVVSRGYHLAAIPANRLRIAIDWALDAVLPRQCVQLGLVRSGAVPLDSAAPELPITPASHGTS